MKISKGTYMAIVLLLALLVQSSTAFPLVGAAPTGEIWEWFVKYLEGMDQLIVHLAWKNIYWYTWLILADWILCTYFYDQGTILLPTTIVTSAEDLQAQCH